MTRFSADYQVAKFTGQCCETGQMLEPGTACIATLCERIDDDGFDRRDYSVQAWEAGARPERLFSYWKTIVPDPEQKSKILINDEVVLELFERLASDDRPQRVAFRFVLGLILMRKKRLKFAGRRGQGEHEQWLLRPRGSDPDQPPIEVKNPQLAEDDIRDLVEHLSEILQSEL